MSYDRYKNKSDRFLDMELDASYEYKGYIYKAELSEEYIGMGDEFPMTKIHHRMTLKCNPDVTVSLPFSPYFHVSAEDFKVYVDLGCPSYSDIGGSTISSSEMLRDIGPTIALRNLVVLITKLRMVELEHVREAIRNRYRLISLNVFPLSKIVKYFPTI